jgi:hypothetical protein
VVAGGGWGSGSLPGGGVPPGVKRPVQATRVWASSASRTRPERGSMMVMRPSAHSEREGCGAFFPREGDVVSR